MGLFDRNDHSLIKATGRFAKRKLIDEPLTNAKEKAASKKEALRKGKANQALALATARSVRKPQSRCENCGGGAHGKGEGRYCSPACARAAAKAIK